MERSIFRKKALEKLSSPDNIHEMVQVISSRSWLALLALAAMTAAVMVWSFFGELPKTVRGQGILIQSGGIAEVTLLGSGIVNQILVEEGQYILKDDTIAIVAQPELQLQIENSEDKLIYLKDKRDKIIHFNVLDSTAQKLYKRKYLLEDQLGDLQKKERELSEKISEEVNVVKKKRLNTIRLDYLRTSRNDLVIQNELQKVNNQLLNVSFPQEKELEQIEAEIQDLKREIDELSVKLSLSAYVKSPYEGKVIELMTKRGQLIALGAPVVSIEVASPISPELEAIIYVPPDEGKKVTKGMIARIAPSTVKIEEWGYIEGIVDKVSEYPSTRYGMARVLGNQDLVQTFSKTESPIAISVKLKRAKTPSKYLWTSAQGPSIEINAGTLCNANIIIAKQKPISLLFPFIK